MKYALHIENTGNTYRLPAGTNLLAALQTLGLAPEAPCGGHGSCGKCRILVNGAPCLACRRDLTEDMTVTLPAARTSEILSDSLRVTAAPDGTADYVLAYDIGTTTVVCFLLDGHSGALLAKSSRVNPQVAYGADVISRIQHAMSADPHALSGAIRDALTAMGKDAARTAGVSLPQIGTICLVGNTAMHHLLLEIDPKPLVTPPYMPAVRRALSFPAREILPEFPGAVLRVLPNIAGFVGGDTVGCMTALRFDKLEELTLLVDIGTNGEMVLGSRQGFTACSTAAGPAFEGAKIQCGMRGAAGAVDHVRLRDGELTWSVIGGGEALGLCGSGVLDLIAALLRRGDVDETGRLLCGSTFPLGQTRVCLTQKDIREVQLAKSAIRSGIELMCRNMGVRPADIRKVYLAGAFGSYLDPSSACAIGMLPPVLLPRIQSIGNAAGAGARLCALSMEEFAYSQRLAEQAGFLELASMPEFNDCFVDNLSFEEV